MRSHARLAPPAVLVVLALASCGQPATAASPTVTAVTSTLTPTSVSTAQPSPAPTMSAGEANCTAAPSDTRLGDLALSAPTVLYGFNSDYMLPAGLPIKPLAVTEQNDGAYVAGAAFESQAVVGPSTFLVAVCNTSTVHTHRLRTFGARLTARTPYTDQLNVLNGCAFLYSRPTGIGGECASGFSPDLELSFQFPATPTLQATATQTPASPVELRPGYGFTISFSLQPPIQSAITTYQFGVSIDDAALVYPTALTTQPMVIAPIARRWAGDYCATAAMQAQIPATIPAHTYYACPQV